MRRSIVTVAAVAASGAGCLARAPGADEIRRQVRETRPADTAADEAAVAEVARLDVIVRVVLARNPSLAQMQEETYALLDQADVNGALPDLELKYEQWGVPLSRPYALGDADTIMLGLRQTFPALGSRDARKRATIVNARIAVESLRAEELDLVAETKRAYVDYWSADQEYAVHLQHVDLMLAMVNAARASFAANHATQEEVLLADLEAKRLKTELAALDRRRLSARARLNALMAREPDAALGRPMDLQPPTATVDVAVLQATLDERRPELRAATLVVSRDQANRDVADREARWPSLMLGADYWYQPTMPEHHAYALMVTINLPWLNPGHRAARRAAEHTVRADQYAVESTRNQVRYQLRDAVARYDAARTTYDSLHDVLLPAAQQAFEAGRVDFAANRATALQVLESLRMYLDVRLEVVRALTELVMSAVDLNRAAGEEVVPIASASEAQP